MKIKFYLLLLVATGFLGLFYLEYSEIRQSQSQAKKDFQNEVEADDLPSASSLSHRDSHQKSREKPPASQPSLALPSYLKIHPINGELGFVFADLTFPHLPGETTLRRHYGDRGGKLLGKGWHLGLEVRLDYKGDKITLFDPSQGEISIEKASDGKYRTQRGRVGLLKKDPKGFVIEWKGGDRWHFDLQGRLLRRLDRNGHGYCLVYKKNRLQKLVLGKGKTIEIDYHQSGLVRQLTDWQERKVVYEYDSQGRLGTARNGKGEKYAFAYQGEDLVGLLTPEGKKWTFKYDKKGRVREVLKDSRSLYRYQYHRRKNVDFVTRVDGQGQKRVFRRKRKGHGKIVKTEEAKVEFNHREEITALETARGKHQYTYDDRRNLLSWEGPRGKTVFRYDEEDQLIEMTDFRGLKTSFDYDEEGRLEKVIDDRGRVTQFKWNSRGFLAAMMNPRGQVIRWMRDKAGRVIKTVDPLGRIEMRKYDSRGRLQKITGPSGAWIQLSYTDEGKVKALSNSAGQTFSYQYDDRGNLTSLTAPHGGEMKYTYDEDNRLVAVENPRGAKAELTWDGYGNLTTLTLPGGKRLNFRYNDRGQLIEKDTLSGSSYSYGYNRAGDLMWVKDPSGKKTRYKRDSLGQVTEILYPGGKKAEIGYNNHGYIQSMRNGESFFKFKRDKQGRILSFRDEILDKTIRYGYGENGLRTSMKAPFGTVKYSRNETGWLKKLTLGKKSFHFTYNQAGLLTDLAYPQKVNSSRIYSPSGRLSEVIVRRGQKVFLREKYSYDGLSNRKTIENQREKITFLYDELNQLRQVKRGEKVTEFSFDDFQNLIEKKGGQKGISFEAKGDQITTAGGEELEYDSMGRLVRRRSEEGTTEYRYNHQNRLIMVKRADGEIVRYGYSVDGRLVSREFKGKKTRYLYDGSRIIGEYSEGELKRSYVYGPVVDMPLMVTEGEKSHYFHRDGAWNIRSISDGQGREVASYQYRSFGSLHRATGDFQSPYLFAGRRWDQAAGLYYNRARFYDPGLGRFLTPDPLGYLAGWNRYIYCGNNPVNFRDPHGEFLHILGGAAIGGAIWGGMNLAFQLYDNGGDFSQVDWGNVAGSFTSGAVAGGLATATMGAGFAFTGTVAGTMAVEGGSLAAGEMAGRVVTNLWHRYFDKEEVGITDGVGRAGLRGLIAGGISGGLVKGLARVTPRLTSRLPWRRGARAITNAFKNSHRHFYRTFSTSTSLNAYAETLMLRGAWLRGAGRTKKPIKFKKVTPLTEGSGAKEERESKKAEQKGALDKLEKLSDKLE